VPDQWDVDGARAFGIGAAQVLADQSATLVVGHDMRPTSTALVAAFCDGVTTQGVDVVNIGLASTDQLYYASGALGMPGAMFTASHNPAEYNGIKFCRAGAVPVGRDTGLGEIRDVAQETLSASDGPQLEVDLTKTDLAAVLHELVATQRSLHTTHDLALTTPDVVPATTDPVRVRQIMENLLDNACKYSQPGTRVEVTLSVGSGSATLRVADQGPGDGDASTREDGSRSFCSSRLPWRYSLRRG
jgi:phosphomannomutase